MRSASCLALVLVVSFGSMYGQAASDARPSEAQAALLHRLSKRWSVAYSSDTILVSIDTKRVRQIGPAKYEVWLRWDHADVQKLDERPSVEYDSSIEKRQLDCTEMRWRWISYTLYMGESSVHALDADPNLPWSETLPETLGEVTLNKLCSDLKSWLPEPKPSRKRN